MKNNRSFVPLAIIAFFLLFACHHASSSDAQSLKIEGLYAYQHAFNYDMDGNHFDVHETGTMAFFSDSTALDSARQVYSVSYSNGDTGTLIFNYISPSRWLLTGDTLLFAGVEDRFRMELLNPDSIASPLAQKIIDAYSAGISFEYHFHIDTLTSDCLKWSYTYRNGHSDTWEFHRQR